MDAEDIRNDKDWFTLIVIWIVILLFIGLLSVLVSAPFIIGYILFKEISDNTFEKGGINALIKYGIVYLIVYIVLFVKLIPKNSKSPKDGV